MRHSEVANRLFKIEIILLLSVIEDQTEEVIPPTPRKTGVIRVRWPSASPPPRMLFVGGRWMRRRDLSVVQEEEEVEEVSDKEEDFRKFLS